MKKLVIILVLEFITLSLSLGVVLFLSKSKPELFAGAPTQQVNAKKVKPKSEGADSVFVHSEIVNTVDTIVPAQKVVKDDQIHWKDSVATLQRLLDIQTNKLHLLQAEVAMHQTSADSAKESGRAKMAKLIDGMSVEGAAKILASMNDEDVKKVLLNVKARQAGKILSAMDARRVARIMN
jgi:flagellar motility protein MotE (MotC chaperone)